MEKRLDCRDIGMDCDFVACASTDEKAIRTAGEHIQNFHGIKGFSKDFYKKARAAVHKGTCESPKACSGGVCKL
jgi:predicted small metal-binding protein